MALHMEHSSYTRGRQHTLTFQIVNLDGIQCCSSLKLCCIRLKKNRIKGLSDLQAYKIYYLHLNEIRDI